MKVQNVLKKRGKSLIAATGIAAVVMLNGFVGGIAGANQAPPVVCETGSLSDSGVATGSAAGGATTAAYPDSNVTAPGAQTVPDGGTKPGEAAATGETSASGSGYATSESGQATNASPSVQTAPDQVLEPTETCALEVSGTSGQTVSVEVCVTSTDVVVEHRAATTQVLPVPGVTTEQGAVAADSPSAVNLNPAAGTKPGDSASAGTTSPEAGAGGSGATELKPCDGGVVTSVEGSGFVVSQGSVDTTGSVSSTSSTCVSVTVTVGVPSITTQPMEPGVVIQGGSNDPNDPNAGKPATGEAVPAQPGSGTTPQPDPFAPPPAPGA